MYEHRSIRLVHDDTQCRGHVALRYHKKRVLVWLDLDAHVTDAGLVDIIRTPVFVLSGNESPTKKSEIVGDKSRSVDSQDCLQPQSLEEAQVLTLRESATVNARCDYTKVLECDTTKDAAGYLVCAIKTTQRVNFGSVSLERARQAACFDHTFSHNLFNILVIIQRHVRHTPT